MAEEVEEKPKRKPRGPDKAPRKRRVSRDLPPDGAADAAPPPPPKRTLKDELRGIAGEYLVSILWGLSWLVCWAMGGELERLSKEELREGSERAGPLLDKFPIVAQVLSFAGLPVWLVRKVAEHVKFPPKPPAPAPQRVSPTGPEPARVAPPDDTTPGASAEELAQPSNVVAMKGG